MLQSNCLPPEMPASATTSTSSYSCDSAEARIAFSSVSRPYPGRSLPFGADPDVTNCLMGDGLLLLLLNEGELLQPGDPRLVTIPKTSL